MVDEDTQARGLCKRYVLCVQHAEPTIGAELAKGLQRRVLEQHAHHTEAEVVDLRGRVARLCGALLEQRVALCDRLLADVQVLRLRDRRVLDRGAVVVVVQRPRLQTTPPGASRGGPVPRRLLLRYRAPLPHRPATPRS